MADLGGGGRGGDALPLCRKKGATPKATGVASVNNYIRKVLQFKIYEGFHVFTIPTKHPSCGTFSIVGVGKKGACYLVNGDLPRQHSFRTSLRFTGPVPADSRH